MKIKFVDIQNYRKLKACRLDFSENTTILVGANNSGKTSAMSALMTFLKKSRHKDFQPLILPSLTGEKSIILHVTGLKIKNLKI